MATATATFSFLRQLGSSIAVVLGTVIYQNVLSKQTSSPTLISKIGPETAQKLSSSFSGSQSFLIANLDKPQRAAVLGTFTFTLSRLWIFYTAVVGFALVVSLFIRPVVLSNKHTVTKTGLEEQERARLEILAAERAERDPAAASGEKAQV